MKRFAVTLLLFMVVGSLIGCKKAAPPTSSNTTNTQATITEQVNPAGGTTVPAEVRYFRGSIGSTLGLQMKLTREGEKLSGNYYYQKIGTRIDLKGTVDKDNNLTLEEFDSSGKQTGIFKGIWTKNEEGLIDIAGNWTAPNGDKKAAFSVHQEPISLAGGAEITAKSIKEKNKKLKYEVDAEYPQVTGAPDGRFEKFNQQARNLVAGKVAEFRKDVAERLKEQEEAGIETQTETSGSDLGVGYAVAFANDDLISITFEIGGYYQGAAHPNSYTRVINYDVKASKMLRLADLFKPGAKYLQAISSYAINDLKKQGKAKGGDSLGDDEWIVRGAGPDIKNYQSWTITPKGLGINFDSYQVAAYVAGPQYVLVPYSALKDLIKPDGFLQQFVK